jgi:iron complex outermembrane receptor protein
VAELLSENNLLYIKSYGSGGIASLHSAGPVQVHTIVTWNGINFNNPMPGQSDLSLLPSGLADDKSISGGGGASLLRTVELFGGLITLETTSDWRGGLFPVT